MKSSLADVQPWISHAAITADARFDGVSTDSRHVSIGNLFVALRGDRFDAHDFLNEVAAKGAAAVVVERIPEGLTIPALIVPDTRVALGQMAAGWRRQFSLPLIGVTGSNGKTTVKEMIASILAAAFGAEQSLATRGNLNNDIGVPLTVFRLDASCKAAVLELGMNHPGEIAELASIAQPTVGLVNNAQREHQEFMESVEAVARENGAVIRSLPSQGTAVFPADDPYTSLWRQYAMEASPRKIMTFGFGADADVSCRYVEKDFGSELTINVRNPVGWVEERSPASRGELLPLQGEGWDGDGFQSRYITHPHPNPSTSQLASCSDSDGAKQCFAKPRLHPLEGEGIKFEVKLAAAGVHNVRNALAATACALAIGVPQEAVIRGLESFAPVNGRLQRKTARKGALVIDDTYNANPDSVRAAIDVLAKAASPRILILGDMGEVGNEGPQFHEEIGAYAKSQGVDRVLALGNLAQHTVKAFGAEARHFLDIAPLNDAAESLANSGATVLVKGSRFMKMERVVQHLVNQTPVQEAH